MIGTGSDSVVVTTPLPIGAGMSSGSQNAGSELKAISSLHPILKLMNIYSDENGWHYDRNLKGGWDVVLARTAEVGEITINKEEAIPPAAYMNISRSLAGACLFPNLTRLQLVNEPLHSSLYHLPLFFSPRLHSLEIDNISPDDLPELDYFLRDPDLQSSLKHVILGPIQYSPRILGAISQCKSVEILTLTFSSSERFDHETISLLGTTPKLQSLTINADRILFDSFRKVDHAGFTGFAALRDICFIGVYRFIEAILKAVEGDATVRALNVKISSDWTTESSSPFYDPGWCGETRNPPMIDALLSVVAKKWSSSLYDFTLVVGLGAKETIAPHPTLPRECIGHFAKLSGLRRLVVSGFHLEGLDDFLEPDDARLARGPRPLRTDAARWEGSLWPNIKEIRFPMLLSQKTAVQTKYGAIIEDVQTAISLSSFCHLIQHCTNLTSFGGLITLTSYSYEFNRNPPRSRLKILSTGSLEAKEWDRDILRTARFLHKVCPDLDKLTTHAKFSPTTWGNIFDAMTTFKEVRREEHEALMGRLSAS